MKLLYDAGLLHGDCLTVTGKTLAENLEDAPKLKDGQKVVMPFGQAFTQRWSTYCIERKSST